jgi:hypothetical protein
VFSGRTETWFFVGTGARGRGDVVSAGRQVRRRLIEAARGRPHPTALPESGLFFQRVVEKKRRIGFVWRDLFFSGDWRPICDISAGNSPFCFEASMGCQGFEKPRYPRASKTAAVFSAAQRTTHELLARVEMERRKPVEIERGLTVGSRREAFQWRVVVLDRGPVLWRMPRATRI